MLRLPGWVVLLVFVPLQVFFAVKLFQSYGFWWALLVLATLSVVATRAAAPNWFRAMFFPQWAARHEMRRHAFQGILLLAAVGAFLLAAHPQGWVPGAFTAWLQRGAPWLPLAIGTSLVKSALR